jgi:hypothetical protein
MSRFELLRAQSTQMAMTARLIVERFDVFGDVRRRQRPIPIDRFLNPLLLQAAEEGLG